MKVSIERGLMTPEEQQQIKKLNDNLATEITIRLRESTHETNEAMAAFLEELASLVPNIRVTRDNEDPQPAPAIEVTESVAYSGVPSGTEFGPFVDLLAAVGEGSAPPADGPLAAIAAPAMLKLYVSSMCPHCPAMVRQIFPLCLANSNLKLAIIDGPAFPELAGTDKVKSLPTLILDGNFRWTASVDTDELLQVIGSRDPAELGAAALKGMIQDGNAYGLSEMMVSAGKIFPAFVELLIHPEFSVRLGAMAAIEDVAENAKPIAGQVVALLMERFDQAEETIKGDILYVIGACGDEKAMSFLESMATASENEDLREAAEDALSNIKQTL
ncbi:MAG: thioredoxin family protein [Thermodesulfobacteriota bacterium]